eukprot:scaffold555_cov109-Isochrysis_galbana.AAC.6
MDTANSIGVFRVRHALPSSPRDAGSAKQTMEKSLDMPLMVSTEHSRLSIVQPTALMLISEPSPKAWNSNGRARSQAVTKGLARAALPRRCVPCPSHPISCAPGHAPACGAASTGRRRRMWEGLQSVHVGPRAPPLRTQPSVAAERRDRLAHHVTEQLTLPHLGGPTAEGRGAGRRADTTATEGWSPVKSNVADAHAIGCRRASPRQAATTERSAS